MNITHDKESGALYIRLRGGAYDHTEDLSEGADVFLDVDAEGNVLGLEALSFEDLAQAIEERGGRLQVPDRLDPAEGPHDAPGPDDVRAAVSSLGPREREIVRLRAYEGLSLPESADRLGISIAAAYRLYRVALAKLRAELYGGAGVEEDESSIEGSLRALWMA